MARVHKHKLSCQVFTLNRRLLSVYPSNTRIYFLCTSIDVHFLFYFPAVPFKGTFQFKIISEQRGKLNVGKLYPDFENIPKEGQ